MTRSSLKGFARQPGLSFGVVVVLAAVVCAAAAAGNHGVLRLRADGRIVLRGTPTGVVVAADGQVTTKRGARGIVVTGGAGSQTVVIAGGRLPGLTVTGVEHVRFTGAATFAGDVIVSASSALCICSNVSAAGDLTFTATDSAASGDNLTISANVTSTTGGTISLQAGDDILQTSGFVQSTGGASNLVRFTSDHEGAGVADGDRGSISQSGGSVLAGSVVFRSAESVGYTGATNDVSTMAGSASLAGSTLSYSDSNAFSVGTVDGLSGVRAVSSVSLSAGSNGDVTINVPLDGAFSLTVTTGGNTLFASAVGSTAPLSSVNTDLFGSTTFSGGSLTTTGGQDFRDNVTLGANTTLWSQGGSVSVSRRVDGAFALTVIAGSATLGSVGLTTPLSSVTMNAAFTFLSGLVKTSGAQQYGPVLLLGDTVLTSTGGGVVEFQSIVDGLFSLTVNTAGATRFLDTVGDGTALSSLTTDAAGSTALNGGSTTTTGAQAFNDAVTLGASTTLTSTGSGNVSLGGTVNGGFSLSVSTVNLGAATFNSPVGGTTALTSLTTGSGSGTTVVNANVTTSGAQSYGNPTTIAASATITAGSVTVTGTGTLKGTGTVNAPVTVQSGGTLSPGTSPGCLAAGNLGLAGGATYAVEVNGATACTQYDRTTVTGTVSLGAAGLSVSAGFTPAPGQQFTIVANDSTDAVSGTFNGLPEGAGLSANGVTFTISYTGDTGNDVVLTAPNPAAGAVTGYDWGSDNPPQGNALGGVSCPTTSFCKAVGAHDGGSGFATVVSWNGSGWSTNSQTGADVLHGVSCATASFCKAVGESGAVISWNGGSWSNDSSGTGSSLFGVGCPAPTLCKAVGSGGTIRSWNGSSWGGDSSGTSSSLAAVSCPTTAFCKAVGDSGTILGWNGTSWSPDSSGTTASLFGVSCATSALCKAVGDNGVILSWNGSAWSSESSPTALDLNGVSCPTTSLCRAVGLQGTILNWSGSSWSVNSSVTVSPLRAVSCPTATVCKAVGDAGTILGMVAQTLVGNGGWTLDTSGSTAQLLGVSCTTASLCKAVGQFGTVLSWNASSWSGDTSGASLQFLGVSCPTASLCKAVGDNGQIRSWTGGTSWSTESAATTNNLRGVSCPTTSLCKAVAASSNIFSWNGSSWASEASGTTSLLQGVSCPTTTLCKAVGTGGTIRSWNGTSWSGDTSGTANLLWDVSCPTTTFCKAVGDAGTILTWNGSSWAADSSGTASAVRGVSCPTTSLCKAVGVGGLILSANGTSWSAESSGTANDLLAVSCLSALCKAVGNGGTIVSWTGPPLLDLVQTGCLTGVTITQTNGNHPNAGSAQQTGRYWTITPSPAGCTSGFSAVLTLPTSFAPDASSGVCRYTGSSTVWDCAQNGFGDSTVTRSNVTQFSAWAAGNPSNPTAVRLTTLRARARPAGIVVSWQTANELGLAGFNLYRSSGSGRPLRLNRRPIHAAGTVAGRAYMWLDRRVRGGTSYSYRLTAIDRTGSETTIGTLKLSG